MEVFHRTNFAIVLLYFLTNLCGFHCSSKALNPLLESSFEVDLEYPPITDRFKYIGCYDVWKGNDGKPKNTEYADGTNLESCAAFCARRDAAQDWRIDLVLTRGIYCGCMTWADFRLIKVSDEFCDIDCKGHSCGGNFGISLYCNMTGSEQETQRCDTFDIDTVIEKELSEVENFEMTPEDMYPLPPVYPCFKCTIPLLCRPISMDASFTYFPRNTPEICRDFCGKSVEQGSAKATREKTTYAIIGWNFYGAEVPVCWCTNEIESHFEELPGESAQNCNKSCPGSSAEICGGNPPDIFAMYLSSEKTEEPSTTSTTDVTTVTTMEPTTTSEPESSTVESTVETTTIESTSTISTHETTTVETTQTTPSETTIEITQTTPTETATSETTIETTTSETTTETGTTESTTFQADTTSESTTTTSPTTMPTTMPAETTSLTTITTTELNSNCHPECHVPDFEGQVWKACAAKLAENPCPRAQLGQATWECSATSGLFITERPDYSKCSSEWFDLIHIVEGEDILPVKAKQIFDLIISKVSVAPQYRATATAAGPDYFGHEISRIFGIIRIVFAQLNEPISTSGFEELTEKAVEINQHILINSGPWTELPITNRSMVGTDLIHLTEVTVLQLTKRKMVDEDKTPYRKYYDSPDPEIKIESGGQSKSSVGDSTLRFPFEENSSDLEDYIELPSGWTDFVHEKQLNFVGSVLGSKFIKLLFPTNLTDPDSIMNGKLMSFSLANYTSEDNPIEFEGQGVTIHFKHELTSSRHTVKELRRKRHPGEEPKPVSGSAKCVYWDTRQLEWSSSGCKLVGSDPTVTTCECSHLTSFAVLMDVHNFVGKDSGLEMLTLILCSLSVLSLIATIVILTAFRSTHSPRTTITKSLCLSLLIGNTSILFFVDRHYFDMSDTLCIASAMATHYAFLTAFVWMAIEGYHLYKMVIHVFDSGDDNILIYRVLAYGLPIIIVGATTVSSYSTSGDAYGGELYCWLQGNYVWTFLGPVGAVVLGNTVALYIGLRAPNKRHSSTAQLQEKSRANRKWVKGCLSLSVTLGLTWVIGYLMLIGTITSILAAYFFTILNASQGMFLFVFHCLMNDKILETARRKKIPVLSWIPVSQKDKSRQASSSKSAENSRKIVQKELDVFDRPPSLDRGVGTTGAERRRRSHTYDPNATVSSLESFNTGSTSLNYTSGSGNESSSASIISSEPDLNLENIEMNESEL